MKVCIEEHRDWAGTDGRLRSCARDGTPRYGKQDRSPGPQRSRIGLSSFPLRLLCTLMRPIVGPWTTSKRVYGNSSFIVTTSSSRSNLLEPSHLGRTDSTKQHYRPCIRVWIRLGVGMSSHEALVHHHRIHILLIAIRPGLQPPSSGNQAYTLEPQLIPYSVRGRVVYTQRMSPDTLGCDENETHSGRQG